MGLGALLGYLDLYTLKVTHFYTGRLAMKSFRNQREDKGRYDE
jgi:hypothetical protein